MGAPTARADFSAAQGEPLGFHKKKKKHFKIPATSNRSEITVYVQTLLEGWGPWVTFCVAMGTQTSTQQFNKVIRGTGQT